MSVGDAEAMFEAAFANYSDAIFRYLFFHLGDRERARELTQEVFMRYWQQLRLRETITHERAYLYRIAHNLFVNEIRTDKKTHSLEAVVETNAAIVADKRTHTPEQLAEHAELLRYLDTLDPVQRTTLILRYLEGWAVQDIAAHLGERENTVSMRINRSLRKLQERYRGQSSV